MSLYTPTPFSGASDSPGFSAWVRTQFARIGNAISIERWYGTTVAAAYTLTPQDRLLRVDTSSAARTITLPLVNTVDSQVFTIKNIGNAGNGVTVNRAGADTIDGATSLVIPSLQSVTLVAGAAGRWDVAGASYEAGLSYLTGTYTPVLTGAGGQSGQVYTTQDGRYTKIGRLVYAKFDIVLSTLGTITGQVQISVPFTASNGTNSVPVLLALWQNMTTAVLQLAGLLGSNTSVVSLYKVTAATANSTGSTLVQGDLSNTTRLIGTIVYEV